MSTIRHTDTVGRTGRYSDGSLHSSGSYASTLAGSVPRTSGWGTSRRHGFTHADIWPEDAATHADATYAMRIAVAALRRVPPHPARHGRHSHCRRTTCSDPHAQSGRWRPTAAPSTGRERVSTRAAARRRALSHLASSWCRGAAASSGGLVSRARRTRCAPAAAVMRSTSSSPCRTASAA